MEIFKKFNINIKGDGVQPMLFAHGYGCDQNMWRFLAPAFENKYKTVLFDYIGAGNSDISAYSPEKYATLKGYSDDIIEICEKLSLKDVVFVGHSVSAMTGLIAAVQRPDIFASLILIGPSPCYINDGDYLGGFSKEDIKELLEALESNYLGWSQQMSGAIMGNPERPELGEELANSFCRANPAIALNFAKTTFLSDARPYLSQLTVPVLIMQCSNDIIAPVYVGEYLAEKIPDNKLVVMQATGHCPHLSAPAETIAVMKEFLPF